MRQVNADEFKEMFNVYNLPFKYCFRDHPKIISFCKTKGRDGFEYVGMVDYNGTLHYTGSVGSYHQFNDEEMIFHIYEGRWEMDREMALVQL